MASLMLLLEVLLKWPQKLFAGEKWKEEQCGACGNVKELEDIVPYMQYDNCLGLVRDEGEPQTWKIAECCIWP